ncbi:hypothetical protein EKD16_01670 [Streptomonospora litoralis]|uniref:Uncharacterized protein n=1 Tax=Streptomonospora litoralis TaxID=2498135 RepID=A0A4P6PZ36_9ACTN|nr:hypothetical protein EKD16_01670 [Streptomonospora litoralis]
MGSGPRPPGRVLAGGGGRRGRPRSAVRPCQSAGKRVTWRKSGGDGGSGAGPAVVGSGARRWRRPTGRLGSAVRPCQSAGKRVTWRKSGAEDGEGLGPRPPVPVPAGGGGRRGAATAGMGPGPRTSVRVLAGWAADEAARAPRGGARGHRAGCSPVRRPTSAGPGLGQSAAAMQPDRGHEMHVRAAVPASAPPRDATPAPSFRNTKKHAVFCPQIPELSVDPQPRRGGDGARGAPNGAKTAPESTFRTSRGRRARRGHPQNGHRPPKVHPIGGCGSRRRHPGAMSDAASPPTPDPAHPRGVRAPATAPRRAASGRCRPGRGHGETQPAHRRR